MKKTPLTRRTPLKRSAWIRRKPAADAPKLKRTPLKQVSDKKAAWNRKYHAAKAVRMAEQVKEMGSTLCERCRLLRPVDGHHPGGQNGARIMRFLLICRPCHTWIHDNGAFARADGWLD